MYKKIYVIQRISSGIAECPTLFIDEARADVFFIKLVNEVHDKAFLTEREASEFLRELDCNPEDIYYWVQEVGKMKKEKV